MLTDWLLSITPMLLLLIIAIILRLHCKTWLHPSAYFSLWVLVYFLIPLIFVPEGCKWPVALWWILASSISLIFGGILTTLRKAEYNYFHSFTNLYAIEDRLQQPLNEMSGFDYYPGLLILLVLSILLGFSYSIFLLNSYGKGIKVFTSMGSLTRTGSEFSEIRYSGMFNPPIIIQIFLPFVFLSPILGGLLLVIRENKKQYLLAWASLLPATFTFLIETTRASLLIAIIMFVAGYCANIVFIYGAKNYPLFTKKRMLILVILILFILLAFAYGDIARIGVIPDIDTVKEALQSSRAKSYLFGHAFTFSKWFTESWGKKEIPQYGKITFNGFLYFFEGKGQQAISPISYVPGGIKSNIYSVFRSFAADFTFIGSLVFLSFFGIIAGIAYSMVEKKKQLWVPVLVAIYAFLGNLITPTFRFTSTAISILLLMTYFIIVRAYKRRVKSIAE